MQQRTRERLQLGVVFALVLGGGYGVERFLAHTRQATVAPQPFPPDVAMQGLDMRQPQAKTLPLDKKVEICHVYTLYAGIIMEWREIDDMSSSSTIRENSRQTTVQHLREVSSPGMVDAMVRLAEILSLLPVPHSLADIDAARQWAASMCWQELDQG